MLIGSRHTYIKIAFENEAEIETITLANAELLFGPYALVLPKSRISTTGGRSTIPETHSR